MTSNSAASPSSDVTNRAPGGKAGTIKPVDGRRKSKGTNFRWGQSGYGHGMTISSRASYSCAASTLTRARPGLTSAGLGVFSEPTDGSYAELWSRTASRGARHPKTTRNRPIAVALMTACHGRHHEGFPPGFKVLASRCVRVLCARVWDVV